MRSAIGSTLALGFLGGLVMLARRGAAGPLGHRAPVRTAPHLPRVGSPSEARASAEAEEPTDAELAERVRAQVPIPADVEVTAEYGAVVLFGRVPRYLVQELLARVSAVEGVQAIEDRLTPVDLVAPGRPPGPPDLP